MFVGRAKIWILLLLLLVIVYPAAAAEVRFFAASSLKVPLDDVIEAYQRKNPGVRVVKNYASSGVLATQIRNGAPADLFVSANEPWISYLRQKQLLANLPPYELAYNTLVFVGRPGRKADSLKCLLSLDRIAIGNPRSVPAGEYAMEALEHAYIDRQLGKKLVQTKDARECLLYAERGEVDGALVYRTEALESKKVKILFTVPQNLYDRVVYPMVLTIAGAANRDAIAFYRYLQGAEAKALLARRGFLVK